MIRTRLAVIILAALFVASANWVSAGDAVHQNACELNRTIKVTMKYLLYLPKDYEQKPSWPLMLFLHGSGERGDDLQRVKGSGPPKLIEAGQQFPFIIVSPQCPKGRFWEPFELTALLDEIVEKYKVDQDRIYVTGLSMGGFGTWSLAAHQPRRFAALVPICGGGDPAWAERLAGIGTFVDQHPQDLDPTVRTLLERAHRHSAADAFAGMHRLRELRRRTDTEWAKADFLLLPTSPTIYTLEDMRADPIRLNARFGTYTNFVNFLGCSAIAVPAGFKSDGLPFGVTLVAPPFHDDALASPAAAMHAAANCGAGCAR